MSKKHNSWKDNEIVSCHLLTRKLASLWYGIDGPTRWRMSFPHFSPIGAFKLPIILKHRSCTAH